MEIAKTLPEELIRHIIGFARPTYPYIDELNEELFRINSCDCCVKGWGESNEYGRCDCWCSHCHDLLENCRYPSFIRSIANFLASVITYSRFFLGGGVSASSISLIISSKSSVIGFSIYILYVSIIFSVVSVITVI